MKKIEAIIRLNKFEAVRSGLADIGVPFFTLKEVKGYGLQKGQHLTYRGSSFDAEYIPRLQIEIFSPDEKVDKIIDAIHTSGHTGEIGDGKIIIMPIEKIVRIRTGETDINAVY